MKIAGSVALVTGGASGLGEATVRQLVSQEAQVVIVDLNEDRGQALAAELGGVATFVRADVSNAEDVEAAVARATSIGTLRASINCAGIGIAKRTIGKDGTPHNLGAFQKVISVNLFGTFNLLRLAASAMVGNEPEDGERGVIINTASVAAFDGQIGQVAYSASKGGIVGLTLPAARDLAKAQIRVVTIAPGTFDTPLLASLGEDIRAALAATIPHPSRLGRPGEFGALACHIVENSYINGEVIRLDGAIRMAPR
ncbi:MAG: SDR family NAD(P)-dependent oxidoreductase [Deltaproteobacteria bacterium]|jgi:NAD(P)-dependent dehydrogenase (short-subunit alcohol dehydrogenase family)|nr:SDR family NAD(P)-dependent oxidoreductase [Deltaproteobacteria bacterium]MBW2402525.1 SDR family NAD(P)-dependent oxidoreductase [Deltaproteobacteria bacterium]MBW2546420.1 SDR family NAD(P)-dependent oxidoreductase [Deltaproteobacteria bacterium]MBW2717817.1 SDR family NAD(P)-dependent oxidoreductase [Deltaproteobacteria bacterium]